MDSNRRNSKQDYRFNILKMVGLAIMLGIASLLLFKPYYDSTGVPDFGKEIAGGFLGAILTIIVTFILLEKQKRDQHELQIDLDNKAQEAELKKERTVQVFEAKLALYTTLFDEIQKLMASNEEMTEARLRIQVINFKMACLAGVGVLQEFDAFADRFGEVSPDQRLAPEVKNKLLEHLTNLAIEIRKDLVSKEEARDIDNERDKIADAVRRSTLLLRQKTTTRESFLYECRSVGSETFFSEFIQTLEGKRIPIVWRTVGFSTLNGKMRCYPNRDSSIEIRKKKCSEEQQRAVERICGVTNDSTKAAFTFRASEVDSEKMLELIKHLGGDGAAGGNR